MQFYEDIPIGMRVESTESFTFTAEEIKSFAGNWDPMPFHLDEDIAKASPIGALFASSIHTIAAGVKLTHTMLQEEVAAIAALGWQDVRFPKPVFAGDSVRIRSEIIEKRESKSKADRGIITSLNAVINQHGDVVAEYKIMTMILKKPV
jgi:acyl dehydratase